MKSIVATLLTVAMLAVSPLAMALEVPSGTPVPLLLNNQINSLGLTNGATVTAVAMEDVYVDETLIIKKDTPAILTVSQVRQPKGHDTDGYMVIEGGRIKMTDGQPLQLRLMAANGAEKATPKLGPVALSVLGVALILTPFGWFIKGEPARFPSGMILNASAQ